MSDKQINLDFKILDWWCDWWRDDKNHYFCAVVQHGEEKYYIERELSKT